MVIELSKRSEANKTIHAQALDWSARLALPHALSWLESGSDEAGLEVALRELFAGQAFPAEEEAVQNLPWMRDPLGKPFLVWRGRAETWAQARGYSCRNVHISNSHDGGAHLVLAAYDEALVGLGIDTVYLPRLRRPGKDRDYLQRFARKFMSEWEWTCFQESAVHDDLEALQTRVAAHFSLMEAASKACGTGLKIGAGMGKSTSLPKESLGVQSLTPHVEMCFDTEARARLEILEAVRWAAQWATDGEYLVSVVLLWRSL